MNVYAFDEVCEARNNVLKRVAELRKQLGDKIMVSHGLETQLQAIYGIKFSSSLESCISDIVLRHALSAERISPGAFLSCIDEIIKHKQESINEAADFVARIPTFLDVENIINDLQTNQPSWLTALVIEALKLAGHGGRIMIERSVGLHPSVERIAGHTFKLEPCFRVVCKLVGPRVLLIDGFIESVAEFDRVLSVANEDKVPLLVFARGAHPDVINTLKINFDRGTLRVVLFTVPVDVHGINQLRDIAAVAGADVVSSDKGQLISSIDVASLSKISSAVIKNNCVVLSNTSKKAVATLVAELRVRRVEAHEALQKVYDERIRSLSGNHIVIRLPDDKMYVTYAQFVDYALRAVKSLVDHGANLDSSDGCMRIAATKIAAELYAKKCLNVLQNLGAVVA